MKLFCRTHLHILTIITVFCILFLCHTPLAHAYSASTVLGQVDGNGNTDFTSNTANRMDVPNHVGYDYPYGLTLDPVGHRLFVSDDNNNRVLEYDLDSNNNLIHPYADHVLGQPDFVSNQGNQGGSPASTTMSFPGDLSYDPSSHVLFVVDINNNRVLAFDLSNGISNDMPASYVLGQPDFVSYYVNQNQNCNGGCSAASTTMNDPAALLYDSSLKTLFVADAENNRVLSFDLSNGISNDMPASYVLGQPDFVSYYENHNSGCQNNCSAASTTMDFPDGLFYNSSSHELFVADAENNRVLAFDLSNGISNDMPASYVLGQPDFVSYYQNQTLGCNYSCSAASTTMNFPGGFAYDVNHDRLFVVDSSNNRVLSFDLSNGISNDMPATNVIGQHDFISYQENSPASTTVYDPQEDMYYDSTNNHLWITDNLNNRVLMFDMSNGVMNNMPASTVLGQLQGGVPIFTTNNSDNYTVPNDQGYNYPYGLALDTIGHRLFVSDDVNNRVLEYNLDSNNNLIHPYADHVLGQPDFVSNQGNQGGSPASTTMNAPEGLSYDSSSKDLFVDDYTNARVLVFDLSNGITNDMPASYVLGQPDFVSYQMNQGGSPASTTISLPNGLVYDSIHDYLFVTDTYNDRVLVFDLSNGITNDMPASYVLGQPDFISYQANQGGSPASTTINNPYTITYDQSNQRLFVDDDGNNRVLIFNLSNGITNDMPASYELGQPDFVSDVWHTASSSEVGFPEELAYDSNNSRLFVADDYHNRILSFDLSNGITNGMAATGVIGAPDFNTSEPGNTLQDQINDPELGMAYDTGNNRLWMTDDSNNRVLAFNLVNLPSSITPTGTVDMAYASTASTTGSQGTVSYALTSGSLPSDITLDPSTGDIAGTPTTVGSSTFTITATDDNGSEGSFTDTKSYTITVSSGGSPSPSPSPSPSSGGSSSSGGGGSVSASVLSSLLAPSASTTAYLNSLAVSNCPQGFLCTANPSAPSLSTCPTGFICTANPSPTPTPPASVPTSHEKKSVTPSIPSIPIIPATAIPSTPPSPPTTPSTPTILSPSTNQAPNSGMVSSAIGSISSFGHSVGEGVRTILAKPIGNASEKILLIFGLASDAVLVTEALLLGPLSSASTAVQVPFKFMMTMLGGAGLSKRRKPWGAVYDSQTKRPLDPAIVTLMKGNTEVDSSITDLQGRYGFLTAPGTYHMKVGKTNYRFPSKELKGKSEDEVYTNLYFGEDINVLQGQVINKNIPLDPIKFDWNEYAKKDQKLVSFYGRHILTINRILETLFAIGLVFSTFAAIAIPSVFNIIVVCLYVLLFLTRIGQSRAYGQVVDKTTGKPLPFALVEVSIPGTTIAKKATDIMGRYYCLVRPGTYSLSVDEKNTDGSYTTAYVSNPFRARGIIKRKVGV